jgi:hypothetical protein
MIDIARLFDIILSTRGSLPAALAAYVAVASATHARRLERYFKSGSGKAFAKKRLLTKIEQKAKTTRLSANL